ncbi:MAG: hypothetical protein KBD55_01480 [Candidatus Pacebacteria bacterium]|nr:hypothetical protein [Candidatus Paceibacterota bacterium]
MPIERPSDSANNTEQVLRDRLREIRAELGKIPAPNQGEPHVSDAELALLEEQRQIEDKLGMY